jgi:hypothetical protein
MRLASKDKQAQVRALEELYIDLISCVQRADVQLAVSKHCKKKQLLMNSGGRVERINGGFIRKWGNQYVKYWLALAELRNDEVIKSSMPGEMYTVYEHYKRDEWEKYNATVTDWDLEMYLDCLP